MTEAHYMYSALLSTVLNSAVVYSTVVYSTVVYSAVVSCYDSYRAGTFLADKKKSFMGAQVNTSA